MSPRTRKTLDERIEAARGMLRPDPEVLAKLLWDLCRERKYTKPVVDAAVDYVYSAPRLMRRRRKTLDMVCTELQIAKHRGDVG